SSDGRATIDYAQRSAPSPTRAAATAPGRRTSTTAPAPAAPAIPTPRASSAAPGARSSGASGATTTPTTPTSTPPCNASSRPEVDTGGLQAALCVRLVIVLELVALETAALIKPPLSPADCFAAFSSLL